MKNLEIENKYLLKYKKALDFIKKHPVIQKKEISQAYIKYSKNGIERIRKSDGAYFFTVKKGSGRAREETERKITKKEYEKLLKKRIGKIIRKSRYLFKIDDFLYELDIFKDELKGLAFLEIEFKTKEQQDSFKVPDILKDIIIKDVSEDKSYTNSSLAISSNRKTDLKKIFASIDKKEEKFSFKAPHSIKIGDFLKIYLYLYLKLLKKYAIKVSKGDNNEDLHQFRVNIRRIRSLIFTHKEIIEEDIYKKLSLSFKKIAQKSNRKRDIDVFLEYLNTYHKETFNDFKNELQKVRDIETKGIKNLINSDEFDSILFDLKMFIEDDGYFYINELSSLETKYFGYQKIKKLFREIKKDIGKLDEDTPLEIFHKVRIKIKKLRYLTEIFSSFGKYKKMIKIIKNFQEDFGSLNDKANQINMINRYITNHKNISGLDNLLKNIKDEEKRIKAKICSNN